MCHRIECVNLSHPDLLSTQSKSQRKITHTATVRVAGTTVYVTNGENLFRPRYARYYFVVLFESPVASKPGKSEERGGNEFQESDNRTTSRPRNRASRDNNGSPIGRVYGVRFCWKNLSQNDDPWLGKSHHLRQVVLAWEFLF